MPSQFGKQKQPTTKPSQCCVYMPIHTQICSIVQQASRLYCVKHIPLVRLVSLYSCFKIHSFNHFIALLCKINVNQEDSLLSQVSLFQRRENVFLKVSADFPYPFLLFAGDMWIECFHQSETWIFCLLNLFLFRDCFVTVY